MAEHRGDDYHTATGQPTFPWLRMTNRPHPPDIDIYVWTAPGKPPEQDRTIIIDGAAYTIRRVVLNLHRSEPPRWHRASLDACYTAIGFKHVEITPPPGLETIPYQADQRLMEEWAAFRSDGRGGRHSKFDNDVRREYVLRARELKNGRTWQQVSARLGIPASTLYDWHQKEPK
jgi:hypothetical protein